VGEWPRMSDETGYVVDERAVAGSSEQGDTASTRVTIDAAAGCDQLEQRIVRFAPGRSRARRSDDRQEVMYVAAGRGRLDVEGTVYELEPDMGLYVAAGEEYSVENAGDEELLLVCVSAPQQGAPSENGRRTVHWNERPSLPASPNREFRFLVDYDLGCRDVTQFVGVIPPGRAPMHSHSYDEVIYVVEGNGVLHLGGRDTPIARGSCIHLPPLVEHCLENTGTDAMRVLGVFHPAGDPASRANDPEG
jgi:mannose-6-phosphate isomerase-like protein (cupin superfamily)